MDHPVECAIKWKSKKIGRIIVWQISIDFIFRKLTRKVRKKILTRSSTQTHHKKL